MTPFRATSPATKITIKIESHGSDADEAPYILELRYGENSVMAFMHTAGGRLSNEQQLPHTLKSNELFDIRTFLVNWDILVYLNRRYLGMFHVNHPLAGHFMNKKIIRSGYNSSLSQMGLEEYDGEWPFDTPNYKLNQVIDLTVKHEESQFKIFINGNYHSRFGKQYNLNHDKSYYGPREVRASEYILILDQTISYIDLDDYVSVNLSEKDD
ncbi:hypothetical protein DdX_16538 [Ditylenchus destructor]|uniref:Galectin n=1 Tax=Ditylenchus destructor TaxID=166010 RepID=A0AAD4QWL2_9BILA|nr:hypothetical protein DdX_16538 [Ditylenchus destructor]